MKEIIENALKNFELKKLIIFDEGYLETSVSKLSFERKKDQTSIFNFLEELYNHKVSFYGVHRSKKGKIYLYSCLSEFYGYGFANEKAVKLYNLIDKFPKRPRSKDINFYAHFY